MSRGRRKSLGKEERLSVDLKTATQSVLRTVFIFGSELSGVCITYGDLVGDVVLQNKLSSTERLGTSIVRPA